jgi:plastocyanin
MKQKTIFTLMMYVFASILFFGCSKSNEAVRATHDASIRGAATTPIHYAARISIESNSFNPENVTIMQGGTVLWTNKDSGTHTVTADNGSFDSGDIQPGGSFSLSFTTIGPHDYHCRYHPEQRGVVKCVTK